MSNHNPTEWQNLYNEISKELENFQLDFLKKVWYNILIIEKEQKMKTLIDGLCYIGDPCYVFSHDEWDEIMEKTNVFGYGRNKEINFNGTFTMYDDKCAVSSTAYGDGEYQVKVNGVGVTTIGVDSGSIGIIPLTAISRDKLEDAVRLGFIIDQGFIPVEAENGVFRFGKVTIDTR